MFEILGSIFKLLNKYKNKKTTIFITVFCFVVKFLKK